MLWLSAVSHAEVPQIQTLDSSWQRCYHDTRQKKKLKPPKTTHTHTQAWTLPWICSAVDHVHQPETRTTARLILSVKSRHFGCKIHIFYPPWPTYVYVSQHMLCYMNMVIIQLSSS